MQRHVTSGWLAQLGEHQPYKLGVTGSNPVPPTIQFHIYAPLNRLNCLLNGYVSYSGPVVQSVRMPACHAGGREFESRPVRHDKLISSYIDKR